MKKINLQHEAFSIVSDQDFDELNKHRWYRSAQGYAVRDKRGKRIFMHRYILNTPKGMETDHINGDTLDNRRQNLRNVTHSQNQKNLKKPITNTSGFKGVSWDVARKKWVAYIYNGKSINLGGFARKEDAAKAYDEAAIKYHGQFARLNYE